MSFLSDLKNKLEKGIESTSNKSKKVLDMSWLTLSIRGKKETEEQMYTRLGKEVYMLWEREKKVELTSQTKETLEKIDDLRNTIAEMEETLADLKRRAAAHFKSSDSSDQTPSRSHQSKGQEEQRASVEPASKAFNKSRELPISTEKKEREEDLDWGELQAIFVCPHCGNRVEEDTEVCPHCKKHVYD
ncbi:zinc ribbon domain-containing protein [Kroppenstedtia pulmonis]|uniref:Zinc ribbon domain-containing protein n=1 Tax=Kroppenstedtia pulmonis TaxID=1380685 RepID=A0A7D4CP15_9BACL|nr:zinc ribbon domain-containing protein [Kroppenstedtia pulmonis]QKG85158.1 zinc ribbon domain-containing protein [Kroppenstedtia pulmonis]